MSVFDYIFCGTLVQSRTSTLPHGGHFYLIISLSKKCSLSELDFG